MPTIKSSRQRWIISQMKKGAWLSEDRDAFMEVSTYELVMRDEADPYHGIINLGYVREETVEKLHQAKLIELEYDGRAIHDKRGKFVITEWDYYIVGHPATLPPEGESSEEADDANWQYYHERP